VSRVRGRFEVNRGVLTGQTRTIFKRWLNPTLDAVTAQAKQEAPVRTGRLRESIHKEPIRWVGFLKAEGKVVADAPYARYVHDGTRPHVIRARRAKALHFYWQGREVFVKSVNHPGTKPNPFMTRAARKVVGWRLR